MHPFLRFAGAAGCAHGAALPGAERAFRGTADTLGESSARPSIRRVAARREAAEVREPGWGRRPGPAGRGGGVRCRAARRNRRVGLRGGWTSVARACRLRPPDDSRSRLADRVQSLRAAARTPDRCVPGDRRRRRRWRRGCNRRDSSSGRRPRRAAAGCRRRRAQAEPRLQRGAPGSRRGGSIS